MAGPPQDVILCIGDSRVAIPNAVPDHNSDNEGYQWITNTTPDSWWDTTGGSDTFWPDLNDQWFLGEGRTLGIVQAGVSGTKASQWDPAYAEFGHPNYYEAAIALLEDALTAGGTLVGILIMLGPNSVSISGSPSAATYAAQLETLRAGLASDYPGIPVYIDIFADKAATDWSGGTANTTYRADMDAVRQGTIDAIDDTALSLGANLTGQVYADNTHPDSEALAAEIARGFYLAMQGGTPAPRMSSVTANSAKTIVTVTVDRALGNSVSSSVGGFRVMDDGAAVSISSATVTSSTTITLTLATAVVGTCAVSFASGADAVGATIPKGATQTLPDASTYQAPLVPFFNETATVIPVIGWMRL